MTALELRPAAAIAPLGRARIGLFAVFMALGGGTAVFASRIPAVKGALHLSSGALGAALLGGAVGLVVAAPSAGVALRRRSPRAVMAAGFVPFVVGLPLIDAAGGAVSLFAVLTLWGYGAGLIDVAMNTEAAALQSRGGRPIMSRFHAGWSVGGLLGAGLGALAAGAAVPVGVHFAVAAGTIAVLAVAALAALGSPVPASAAPVADTGSMASRRAGRGLLVALGAITFGDFLAEGAANDWSGVYLHSSLGATPGVAALGFTAFALAMAAGRLAGDHLAMAFGPVRLVRLAGAVAAGGLAAALLVADPVAGVVGFGLLGAGLSVVVPQAFSAAAAVGTAGTSMAAVTGAGYLGLTVGPPLIGGLADVVGVGPALVVAVVAAGTSVVLAGAVRSR